MFNRTNIISKLTGLVGFDNPANPSYQIVNAGNQISRSGRKYTDNPFCKIEWAVENQDYIDADTDELNDVLTNINNQAITHVCDKVFENQDFIDRQILYQHANNKINTDTLPDDNFVGYRIFTTIEKGVAFKITRILLEFEGTGTFNLYLFNSSQKTPLQTKSIEITSTNQSVELNWVIDYSDVAYYKGQFYLGYLSNESKAAGLQPIKRDYENSNIKSCITYMHFENIQVPGVTTAQMFDLEDINGAEECWGLNPDITVYKDYTDTIIQNEMIFAMAIQLQGQVNFLSMIISSKRSNIDERLSKEMIDRIMVEIEGLADTNKTGLKRELLQELNSLRKEIKKLKSNYYPQGFYVTTRS